MRERELDPDRLAVVSALDAPTRGKLGNDRQSPASVDVWRPRAKRIGALVRDLDAESVASEHDPELDPDGIGVFDAVGDAFRCRIGGGPSSRWMVSMSTVTRLQPEQRPTPDSWRLTSDTQPPDPQIPSTRGASLSH